MSIREVARPEAQRSEEEIRLASLMVEAQSGNSESYRKLLVELNTMLEKYATRALKRFHPNGDVSQARDVVQEVLMAIHDKRHTYDSSQRFLPWVYGIARHKLIDWQRKHYSERKLLDLDFELDELVAPEESLLSGAFSPNGELSSGLQSLLGKLHPKQREVIELTKIQGLSVAEAAAKTGLSEANVKVLTHRGISTLKKFFEEEQGNG